MTLVKCRTYKCTHQTESTAILAWILCGLFVKGTFSDIWQGHSPPATLTIHVASRYEKARKIKLAQDDYCTKATRGEWAGLGEFPEDLQWEALVDVLRGRVKVAAAWHPFHSLITNASFTTSRFKHIATRRSTWTISLG